MMDSQVYLDSNVLVYAFCEQPDADEKQQKSVELISDLIKTGSLCLSNLAICEFAYILKRLNESNEKIQSSIEILEQFVKKPDRNITLRLFEIMNVLSLYKNSFDCYHLSFAEIMNCREIVTFDKDFNKLKAISKIKITVLKADDQQFTLK